MGFYRDEVLADSPLIYFTYDTSSLSANSGSRSGVSVISSGGYAFGTGRVITAPDFTGPATAARVEYDLNSNSQFNSSAWTIEFFFKVDSFSGGYMQLFQINDGTSLIDALFDYSSSQTLKIRHRGSTGGTIHTLTTSHTRNSSWHHFALTRSGTTLTAYIDGSSVGSTTITTTPAFATGTRFYLGAWGNSAGSDNMDGPIDELAIYSTALSSGRISTHSAADLTKNGGYTAQVMTASATNPDAVGVGNVQTLAVTDDALPGASVGGSQTTYSIQLPVYFKYATPTLPGADVVRTATLFLRRNGAGATSTYSVDVYSVDSAWTESTITTANDPSLTFVRTVTVNETAGQYISIDVSGADTGNGFAITDNFGRIYSSTEGSNAPYVVVTTGPVASASPSASPMTASTLMVDPTIDATDTVSASGQPMTAAATFVDPGVSTSIGDVNVNATALTATALVVDPGVTSDNELIYNAEPMAAAATWPTTNGFSLPATGAADAMTASATTVDASVATQQGPRITAAPMTAESRWKAPALVNDEEIVEAESDDKYFQRVYADSPIHWFRLNDKGSVAVDRMQAGGAWNGAYEGDVLVGQNNGPDGRHNVHFPGGGGWIRQEPPLGGTENNPRTGGSLEFSIKTAKANQFIMMTFDSLTGTISNTQVPMVEIHLKGGKITYKSYDLQGNVTNEFTGFTNLADNQWHTVTLTWQDIESDQVESWDGVSFYVDGKFEIRRGFTQWTLNGQSVYLRNAPFPGFPDYIGSRPEFIASGIRMPPLSASLNFEGDMSEVSYFNYPLNMNQIPKHYYYFMGWNPIDAGSMDAFAFTPDGHHGRGNQKRALYLWWTGNDDLYSVGAVNGNNKPNLNAVPGVIGTWNTTDYAGYKVFSKSIIQERPGFAYRDPVYDLPDIIDLEHHVDIEDYDLIIFGDWPDEGSEFDTWRGYIYNFQEKYERLLRQLRWANDKGISLIVTQPRLAIDLGVVDRVEWTQNLKEIRYDDWAGAAANMWDYGAAVHWPWNIAGDINIVGNSEHGAPSNGQAQNMDPDYLRLKAHFIGDTHNNNRFRVRALIEGLTDIPSYMLDEHLYIRERDQFGDPIVSKKYLHRMNGLQIGDEFIYHGTDLGYDKVAVSADYDPIRYGRWYGTWATPLANVKAGTVVTTFGQTHWFNEVEVENPYKDYATTIVLRPGDYLNGTRVGGKIFVNYSEQPNSFVTAMAVQVLPGSIDDVDGNAEWVSVETPEQAAWEYSGTRYTYTSQGVGGSNQTVTVTLPGGGTFETSISSGSGNNNDQGAGWILTRAGELYPLVYYPHIPMVLRGLLWLRDTPEIGDGDVFPSVQPLTATAEMPNPTVVAEKDADYTAQPMRAIAQMPKVVEDESGDAEILTLPMEASADFTNYSKVISAAPMTATAELVESFDMVHTSGEQVVLTLHGLDLITLYLKEEE